MTTYSLEVVFDPPLTEVDKSDHDYVNIEISSEQEKSLQWFLTELRKTELWERLVVEFAVQKTEE